MPRSRRPQPRLPRFYDHSGRDRSLLVAKLPALCREINILLLYFTPRISFSKSMSAETDPSSIWIDWLIFSGISRSARPYISIWKNLLLSFTNTVYVALTSSWTVFLCFSSRLIFVISILAIIILHFKAGFLCLLLPSIAIDGIIPCNAIELLMVFLMAIF